MKKILLSLVAVTTMALSSFSQSPESFKYQAVVRDAGNLILDNQAVGVQLTIQQGSVGGTAVYTETFAPTTNAYGLVNLEIGTGTTTDDFSTIDWANGPYFIETAVDVTGGTSYTVMGTSQLMSVPYALHANTAENVVNDQVDDADNDPTNELNTGLILNGTDLELTDAGGTITADLSTLSGGGAGNWALNATDITNTNSGNVGVGLTTPAHLLEVGSTDTNAVVAIGHSGNFNEVNSGALIFEEDLEFANLCGIKLQHNGSSNDLFFIGGCSTPDTIARFNRAGQSNIQRLKIGGDPTSSPTSDLTIDGDVQVNGNINVTGNIAKGGGTFKIDHPLDPANKYLVHSFVESPDMMNIYTGNVKTDADGFATVKMPQYFEAANKDFRYQLTVIGTFAQAIVKEKISNNTFVIQTNKPNVEVSWTVTGVRADNYANANRVKPEEEKEVKGTYVHPELYDVSPEHSVSSSKEQQLIQNSNANSQDADK